jgi:hypothetical protein
MVCIFAERNGSAFWVFAPCGFQGNFSIQPAPATRFCYFTPRTFATARGIDLGLISFAFKTIERELQTGNVG